MGINKYIGLLFFLLIWILSYITLYRIFFFNYVQIDSISVTNTNKNITINGKIYTHTNPIFYANTINNQTCKIDVLNRDIINTNLLELKNNKMLFTTIDNNNICTRPENLISVRITNILFNVVIFFFCFLISIIIIDLLMGNVKENDKNDILQKEEYDV